MMLYEFCLLELLSDVKYELWTSASNFVQLVICEKSHRKAKRLV